MTVRPIEHGGWVAVVVVSCLAWLATCGHRVPPPGPGPLVRSVSVSVYGNGALVADRVTSAALQLTDGRVLAFLPLPDPAGPRLQTVLPADVVYGQSASLSIVVSGFLPFVQSVVLAADLAVSLTPAPPALPPPPTRAQALAIQTSGMQGLMVRTTQFGDLPWFEAALSSLTAADRQVVYATKHAVGDTHCLLDISWNYAEPGQPYGSGNRVPPRDMTTDLMGFRALVEEIIRAGFIPVAFLAGDGQSNPGGGYNDQVGWTYGYQWLYSHIGVVIAALQVTPDLTPFVVFVPGFDGVFYGWEPVQVAAFGSRVRAVCPACYLAIEHDIGHLPVGGGPADYDRNGPMSTYDGVLSEFDPFNLHQDSTWQVAGRLLGPLWRRPPDMPAGDDLTPPWYLFPGTDRGPYMPVAFEHSTYGWVRRRTTTTEVAARRQYLRQMGWLWVN